MTQDSLIKAENISLNDEKKPFFSKAMLHNGRQNIVANLKLMIIIFILHLMGAPLLIVSAMVEISKTHDAPVINAYAVIALFTTAMGVAAGILCALGVFGYLYKKTDVDMHTGLPMSTAQRFVSDFFSGLLVYVVPFIAAQIFTFILMLAAHIGYDGKTFSSTENIGESWTCSVFGDVMPYLWKGILGGILIMIMFYTVTVLAACLCGSIFESVGYSILLNVLVPLIAYLIVNVITKFATGVSMDRYIYKAVALCGPAGGVFGLLTALENGMYDYTSYAAYSYVQWFLLFLLITIIIGICTYLIYRRRKAEDTGKPVVFGIFYHIILAMAMFVICYVFLLDDTDSSGIVPMLIVTAVVYFVFHVARNRGFGKIIKGIVIYAVTVGACTGSYYVIKGTEGFGIGDYVPDSSSVKSINIDYKGFDETDYYSGMLVYSDLGTQITDDENIKTLTEIHRHYVDNKSNDNYWGRNMEICYRLKSGKTVYRSIYFDDEAEKMLLTLDTSEDLRRARADYAEYTLKTAEQSKYDVETADLTSQWSDSFYEIQNGVRPSDSYVSVAYDSLPDDFIEKLSEAMRTDIMNETEEDYFRSQAPEYNLYVKYTEISVKGNYTNTLEYLRSCGLDAGNISEVSEEDARAVIESEQDNHIIITDIGLADFFSGREFNGNIGGDWELMYDMSDDNGFIGSCNDYTLIQSYHEDIRKLLEVSRTKYKSDDVRYTIFVDGADAAIPAEYNDLAERVFIRSVADYYAFFCENTEQTEYTEDNYKFIRFIGTFCEYCGKDKITAALEYYYGKETASAIYDAMSSLEIPADYAA